MCKVSTASLHEAVLEFVSCLQPLVMCPLAPHHQHNTPQPNNSNQSLQQQLQSSSGEAHSSKRALLQSEFQKHAAQQQVEVLHQQLAGAEHQQQELHDTVNQL